ncbi:zinc ribbon domain-containing protein [Shewanella atlantica]|uniref:Zinc ribbon domain-containing protein n=1 Tax=Shewanella atlantica TaxID=271099 RepID=A0A3S0IIQ8_9GAMM|nr:zinc ribbon domain-containing protein [Shewanella atlantica]RTR33420.1 zinc ribbon domain-containing protein [Shewanella atlantica]
MALIECPSCKKRISNKAKECSSCGANLSGNTESLSLISNIKRSNQLMNQSLLCMSLFIAGVVVWFWGGEPAEGIRSYIAGGLFVLGFVGYLITRVRIVLHKRKKV